MDINQCWYKNKCRQKCTESCIRYNLMLSLFKQSELPEVRWKKIDLYCDGEDLDNFKLLNDLDMEKFVSEGRNLYIYSNVCGNGKTSWSIRLMQNYFDAIWHKSGFNCKAVFVSVQKFLFNCKRSISQKDASFDALCKKIEKADLVIWDDIDCAVMSDYEYQILFQYIDDRELKNKSNIFTGNTDYQDSFDTLGDRLSSRVFCDYIVEFVEKDKRRLMTTW